MNLADYRKLAGIQAPAAPAPGATPVPTPTATANDGIPTLSLAQFAALTGMEIPDQASAAVPNSAATGVPLATGSVETTPEPDPLATEEPAPQTADAATSATTTSPTLTGAAEGEATDGIPVSAGETPESAPEEPKNDRLVLLDTYPDRDEQKSLAAQGKHWRMKDTPGAKELFMGPDGEFGWDDFVDIINPLQHIPVVAQIYRAVTGDQAYGLSNFIGAMPFGPLSVASAVVDTVVRAQTGRDAGTDLAAAVLGIDNRTPEEANLHLVTGEPGQMAAADTSTTDRSDLTQVASLPSNPTPEAWTRDAAGVGRD